MSKRLPTRRRLLLLGSSGALSLLGCGGGDGALPKVSAPPDVLAMERAMADRVNRDRAARGLPSFTYDVRLADVARFHADDMRKNKFFAHDSPTSGALDDRLARAPYVAAVARENLAEGPDVDRAEEGLLKSPGHHANIMATDVTHLGVGIVKGGLGDPQNFLFVQVFARPVEQEPADVARERILARINDARRKRGLPAASVHPVLGDLADALMPDLPDDIAPARLERIGKEAVGRLAKAKTDLSGVAVTGARILGSSEYDPPSAVVSSAAKGIGLAVAAAKDDKGGPALKVLLLVGQ